MAVEMDAPSTFGVVLRQTGSAIHQSTEDVDDPLRVEASVMKVKLVAIDLAKRVFQVCAIGIDGKLLFNRKLSREKFILWLKDLLPTIVAMEACGTAHYWGRRLQAMGHQVRLVPPQHVKAFVRVHKSDRDDALAIAEAAQRPNLHFVPVKTIGQQDLQLLGRIRSALIARRTAVINQLRGFAAEYGIVIAKSRQHLMRDLPDVLADADNGLSFIARQALSELRDDLLAIDARIDQVTAQLVGLAEQEPAFERLLSVPGFGPIVGAAFVAAVGSGKQFRRGRDVAAWLGLIPRRDGTGGKVTLKRITKSGDRDLRLALIHGARAVLRWADRHEHVQSQWLLGLKERRGANKTIVAFANKMARIGWAVTTGEGGYRRERAFKAQPPRNTTATA
jgi:transposase